MTHTEELEKLTKRLEMAKYQRKITTQISTVWEYDREIFQLEDRIAELKQIKPAQ